VHRFIHRHAQRITGILSGFDRLVLRGTLRQITYAAGMFLFLCYRRILLKDAGEFFQSSTELLREASLEAARRLRRPVIYIASSKTDKESTARRIAAKDGVREGLVCVLEAVEPCRSFEIFRNRDRKRLELVSRWRKCKFLYHYWIDPVFGFMNARIQTWFPFDVQICLNGREWLARKLDAASIGYERRDNCFPAIDDLSRAQKLMDQQLRIHWPSHLGRIATQLNPAHDKIFQDFHLGYYWSVHQSEWATDLMFQDPGSLAQIYPGLVRHGMTNLSSGDVMRFLGQKVHGGFQGQIVSDFKDRPEGIRIKHRVNANSIKLYDKQGSVLRAETTINDAAGIKVFRPKEGDPRGELALRPLRQGIADLHRRAQVSHAANGRYLDALASADTSTPASHFLDGLDQPTDLNGHRVRGLRAWSANDLALFKAVSRGEFSINGFRNVDLDRILNGERPEDPMERRRRSARTTRQIRLLRAHKLIQKVPRSRRYHLSPRGREILSTLLALHDVTLEELRRVA
jgi:hypothetical protein